MTTPAQIAAAEIAFAHESVGRADDAGRLARFVVALWDQLGDQKMRRIAAEEENVALAESPTPPPAVVAMERDDPRLLYPIAEYHEDDGAVLWWHVPIQEPPHAGSPLETDFDREFYTHFSFFVMPSEPGRSAPVASEPTPPPGNSGIPEGWKLGDGWARVETNLSARTPCEDRSGLRRSHADGGLTNHRDAVFVNQDAGRACCMGCAVEMRAIVPVEPPAKAEPFDAMAALKTAPAKPEAAQAGEPAVESGERCRCRAMNGQCPREWTKLNVYCDGCANATCNERHAWQAAESSAPPGWPFGGLRAEPAAPPVTAKLSDLLYIALNPREVVSNEHLRRWFAMAAELETALGAANRRIAYVERSYREIRSERDAALLEAVNLRVAAGDARSQLATRDSRIAGLEASAAEDSKARAALEARCAAAEHDRDVWKARAVEYQNFAMAQGSSK